MEFIDIEDLTTAKDKKHKRIASFAFLEKNTIPNTLRLMGKLSHNSVLTFDRKNAKKMRDFCQRILDIYEK